jgi:hypothetical protein
MAIDKSKWNKNVKVSQGTIDLVKGMGMKSALNMLADYSNPKVKNLPGNKEYVEAVRRLYGETRFMNNTYKPKNSPGVNTNEKPKSGLPKR